MCARSYESFVVSRESHGDEAHGDCAGFGCGNLISFTLQKHGRDILEVWYLFLPLWVELMELEDVLDVEVGFAYRVK